ncbi:hypothetical protein MZO42_20465 [Sphingomonas psychrotolerans]|uniref:Sel1 repeat family protein n=1 Tax=Sphingomonas psychrotolerans TaxID=1327635 RepID=A0ABU3N991_9SPHN|nr:hypothetical protein [Sphingomonas psychrotolerans]MDT8761080.1 hypothetical protein [Sphingomonas psychrotolerans]
MQQGTSDRLANNINRWLDGNSPSDGIALVRHLALRGDPDAITELDRLAVDRRPSATPLSAAGMAHRAAKRGHAPAAYNLAMQCFNNGDLQAYRYWLRRAAKAGDANAVHQLARFEVRLPHGAARDIGRGRPYRSYDQTCLTDGGRPPNAARFVAPRLPSIAPDQHGLSASHPFADMLAM